MYLIERYFSHITPQIEYIFKAINSMYSMQNSYKVSVSLSTVFIIEKVIRFIDRILKNYLKTLKIVFLEENLKFVNC
jgi:hypothetical protein